MKKVVIKIVFILISTNIIASDCTYYTKQMMHQVKTVDKLIREKPTNWCNLADHLELTVNYLDSTKQTCPYDKKVYDALKMYKIVFTQAIIKCGH